MGTIENQAVSEEVLKSVRIRYRICNYLFKLGFAFLIAGVFGQTITPSLHADPTTTQLFVMIEVVGMGIFLSAFVMTLAIYRCPTCDKYLSRFRPHKEYCPSCGTQVFKASE
jgi:energy-converting hydrogenase Eha subunit E